MKDDLNSLSLSALKSLKKQIDKAVEGLADRHRQTAVSQLEARAKELGFPSLSSVLGDGAPQSGRKRTPPSPKYRNPHDHQNTWSGRGRKPAWFSTAISSGSPAEDMLI